MQFVQAPRSVARASSADRWAPGFVARSSPVDWQAPRSVARSSLADCWEARPSELHSQGAQHAAALLPEALQGAAGDHPVPEKLRFLPVAEAFRASLSPSGLSCRQPDLQPGLSCEQVCHL